MTVKRRKAAFRLLKFPPTIAPQARAAVEGEADAHYALILEHLAELRDISPGALEFVANVTRTMAERLRETAPQFSR